MIFVFFLSLQTSDVLLIRGAPARRGIAFHSSRPWQRGCKQHKEWQAGWAWHGNGAQMACMHPSLRKNAEKDMHYISLYTYTHRYAPSEHTYCFQKMETFCSLMLSVQEGDLWLLLFSQRTSQLSVENVSNAAQTAVGLVCRYLAASSLLLLEILVLPSCVG